MKASSSAISAACDSDPLLGGVPPPPPPPSPADASAGFFNEGPRPRQDRRWALVFVSQTLLAIILGFVAVAKQDPNYDALNAPSSRAVRAQRGRCSASGVAAVWGGRVEIVRGRPHGP